MSTTNSGSPTNVVSAMADAATGDVVQEYGHYIGLFVNLGWLGCAFTLYKYITSDKKGEKSTKVDTDMNTDITNYICLIPLLIALFIQLFVFNSIYYLSAIKTPTKQKQHVNTVYFNLSFIPVYVIIVICIILGTKGLMKVYG